VDATCRAGRQWLRFAKEKGSAILPAENLLDLAVYGRSPDPKRLRCRCSAAAHQQGMIDCSGLDLGHGQQLAVGPD